MMEKVNRQEAIKESASQLKNGNVILFPSDTIWGLSCDATNAEAVEKIIKLKGRSEDKSFIVLVNSDRMVNQCIKEIPAVVWDMMDLSDQPLTLVLEGGKFVAPNAINKDGSLAIRMVRSGAIFELLQRFNKPIISTSANLSGKTTPRSFNAIDENLKANLDYIYPLLQTQSVKASPSNIIKIATNGTVEILRK